MISIEFHLCYTTSAQFQDAESSHLFWPFGDGINKDFRFEVSLVIQQIWLINYLIDTIWFFSLIKNTTEVGTKMTNAKLGCDFGEYTCGNICCPFSCFCCTKSTNKEFCECSSFCPWCKFHIHIEPLNLNRKYRVKWSSLNKNVHNYISTYHRYQWPQFQCILIFEKQPNLNICADHRFQSNFKQLFLI